MSEQGKLLNRQSEPLNLEQEDYKSNEEKELLLAFAKLRSLNDEELPLSLQQSIARTLQLSETYRRWKQSNAAIKDIDVRFSNGQKITVSQNNGARGCRLRLKDNLPPDLVVHIWKEADEEFDEVLLLTLSLSDLPPNGYRAESKYTNGQTLSIRVEHCSNEEISLSMEFTEPEAQYMACAAVNPNTFVYWGFLRNMLRAETSRFAYAFIAVFLVMGSLQVSFLLRKHNFGEPSDSEMARVLRQDTAPSILSVLPRNKREYIGVSNSTAKNYVIQPVQMKARRMLSKNAVTYKPGIIYEAVRKGRNTAVDNKGIEKDYESVVLRHSEDEPGKDGIITSVQDNYEREVGGSKTAWTIRQSREERMDDKYVIPSEQDWKSLNLRAVPNTRCAL